MPQLIDELKAIQTKRCALVYCQRYRTPYFFDDLNYLKTEHNIEVFSIVKDFISSKKKQKYPELLEKKALHQSPELELKSLDFILCKGANYQLLLITAAQRGLASVPGTPSKRHL